MNGKAYEVKPESLVHWEILLEANDEVVRFKVVVERFKVLPLQARFMPAVILFEGVV